MFKARTLILGLFALAAATGAGLAAKQWLVAQRAAFEAQLQASIPKAEEKKESVEILVSAATLPTGTFLKDKHLQWVPFPEESVLESYFIKEDFDPVAFDGAVARASPGGLGRALYCGSGHRLFCPATRRGSVCAFELAGAGG